MRAEKSIVKLQVLSVYMCPYINTTAINEQRRVAETPWQHPTGDNPFIALALHGARNAQFTFVTTEHQTIAKGLSKHTIQIVNMASFFFY